MSLQIQPNPEKQQPEFDLSFSAMTWLEENKRLLTIAFVIVSVGVVGLKATAVLHFHSFQETINRRRNVRNYR